MVVSERKRGAGGREGGREGGKDSTHALTLFETSNNTNNTCSEAVSFLELEDPNKGCFRKEAHPT